MNTVAGSVTQAVSAVLTGAATVYVVRRGDTLSGIAAAYLGDPGRWREIARANKIVDPFRPAARARRWSSPRGPRAGRDAVMSAPSFAPRFEVRISGVTLAADLADQVLSLTVETDLDLAGSFNIVLRNPDNRLLDSALLDLGKTVEIHLGYGNDLSAGVPRRDRRDRAVLPAGRTADDRGLRVRQVLQDAAYPARAAPTTRGSTTASSRPRSRPSNGLIPVVDPTPVRRRTGHPGRERHGLPEGRAEQYFFDVYVEWDRLHFQFPRPQLSAHVLEWGKNLSSFSPRISAAGLAGLQVSPGSTTRSWHRPFSVTVLAADFDLDNLVERLGSSALDLLSSLVSARESCSSRSSNPLDAYRLARLAAGRPAGGDVRRDRVVHRHPGPDGRAATSRSGHRAPVQRHLPGCAR